MPEKPEVQHTANCLHKVLQGQVLQRLCIKGSFQQTKENIPNYQQLVDLLPLKLINVWSKGKKIIICLEGNAFIVSSLSMEGKWLLKEHIHSNLWLELSDGRKIYYDDSRHFGKIEIFVCKASVEKRLDLLGPDLLNDIVTPQQWLQVVRNGRIKHMYICEFLLKQKYFSGVGNYIRAEALYRAKIRPDATLEEMTDQDHDRVRRACIQVIQESFKARGCTLKTYWDMNGYMGEFEVVVYNKKMDPDGNTVIKTVVGKRMIHWVPFVQINPPKKVIAIDIEKLKRSTARGTTNQYSMMELRELARYHKLSTGGTKSAIAERLLKA